jgi:hypothetical protein
MSRLTELRTADSAEVAADAEVAVDTFDISVTTTPEAERIEPGSAVRFPDQGIADKRWVKPLQFYERKETTIVEGLRYG